jgi:hypothetical protein
VYDAIHHNGSIGSNAIVSDGLFDFSDQQSIICALSLGLIAMNR